MSLVVEEFPLAVLPELATRIGANGALILQQIHYWLEKSKHIIDGCKWIYNSYQSWHKQFPFISLRTLKRQIAALRALQLIRVERFQKRRWNQTNWYTIDYERLKALSSSIKPTWNNRSGQLGPMDCANLAQSLTETSTETSTNTTTRTNHPVHREDKQGILLPDLARAKSTLNKEATRVVSDKQPRQKDQEVAKPPESQQVCQLTKPSAPKCYIKTEPTKTKTNPGLDQVTPAAAQPLLKQAEDLGIRLNQNLKKLVLSATLETVRNALGVLKQSLESPRPLKNPPGLLAEAIKQQWKPNQAQDTHGPRKASAAFTEWFNLAYELRLVSGSELKDGVQYVYTPDGNREPWETLTAIYPLANLRSQATQKRKGTQELIQTKVKKAPVAAPLKPPKVVEKAPSLHWRSRVTTEMSSHDKTCSQNMTGLPLIPPPSPTVLAEFREWVNLASQVGIISDSNIVEGQMLVYSGGAWHEWTEFSATFTTRYLRCQLKEKSIIRRE